jgi:hypothetical protein
VLDEAAGGADGGLAEEVVSEWVPHAEIVMTNGAAHARTATETRGEFTVDTLQLRGGSAAKA